MKKFFTLIAAVCMAMAANAQVEGVDTLALSTYNSETQTFSNGYTITGARPDRVNSLPTGSGPFKDAGDAWTNGINFKNNSANTIKIPEGVSVYRIEILGCSQGDNWDYILAYGAGDNTFEGVGYEYVDPIGKGVTDNVTIRTTAKYPVDPCTGLEGASSNNTEVASTHHAGYMVAALDFGNEPYSGEFPFYLSGNNQHDYAFVVYTTRAAADEAANKQGGQTTEAKYVELSMSTYDATTGTFAENYTITGARPEKAVTLPTGSGPFKDAGDAWTDGINFKNNSANTIKIPEGVDVYRIEIFGCSQGDNWDYILAYGAGDNTFEGVGYEFVDPIGKSVTDNVTIRTTAKYPVDPCTGLEGASSNNTEVASTNHAGYMVAALDFGNQPYSGEFPFYVSGNNQHDYAFRLYTSRADADAATTGIKTVSTTTTKAKTDGAIYNLAGQRVSKSYKGVVIINGKKYLNK